MNTTLLDYLLRVRLPALVFVILGTFTVTYFASKAERQAIGYQPEQPIPYSHKLHVGQLKLDCRYCHQEVEKGRFATVPPTETCMNCHNVVRQDSPHIQKLKEYHEKGEPVPWKRVHKLPDFVFFNHSVHVNSGVSCYACHGKIEEMDEKGVKQAKPLMMADCLSCHRNAHKDAADYPVSWIKNAGQEKTSATELKKGPEHCSACHR